MAAPTYALKLRRASEHFDAFNQALKWWLDDKPYSVEEQINTEANCKELVVLAKSRPPERLSLMLGDCIQNFRSALDYLVGDLARAAVGDLKPALERRLQYPITTSRANFKEAITSRRLVCVPPRAAATIQKLQPYRRGQDPKTHPLWVIHQLSNTDKHRRIPLLLSVVRSISFNEVYIEWAESAEIGIFSGPFEEKAVIARFRPADAKVNMDVGAVRVGIALGKGLPAAGEDPSAVLAQVTSAIGAAIFEPLAAYL